MGKDIYNNNVWGIGGTVTVHDICPSPYTAHTPIKGDGLSISQCGIGCWDTAVLGSAYSYSGCSYECPAGQFNPTGGNAVSSCEACPAGKHTPNPGYTLCLNCGAGKYSGVSSPSCTPCPAGRYQTDPSGATDTTACTGCLVGTYGEVEGSGEMKRDEMTRGEARRKIQRRTKPW